MPRPSPTELRSRKSSRVSFKNHHPRIWPPISEPALIRKNSWPCNVSPWSLRRISIGGRSRGGGRKRRISIIEPCHGGHGDHGAQTFVTLRRCNLQSLFLVRTPLSVARISASVTSVARLDDRLVRSTEDRATL